MKTGKLKISDNGRYLQHESGQPFFWLGDTGWLLFSKVNREEADKYLTDRASSPWIRASGVIVLCEAIKRKKPFRKKKPNP